MSFELSHQSLVNLQGVHPDLVRLVMRTLDISPLDFAIIQGVRTQDEEREDIAKGLSQTTHSRHLVGMAVDFMAFVNGKGCWLDNVPEGTALALHPYHQIAAAFKQASTELNIPIVWGGTWKTLVDLDHIELDRNTYPDPPDAP
jgi:peptidoglycan L-alanyl-D-glutamate endopeptidase CwlK